MRSDRPRLIAPQYKWDALPNLIQHDPYLSGWNSSIFGNASQYFNLPPVVYHMDGSSGILDNSREIKMRVKAFAYAYRMTNDAQWKDRLMAELTVGISVFFQDPPLTFLVERRWSQLRSCYRQVEFRPFLGCRRDDCRLRHWL